jgi:hypothetical protein
VSTSTIAGLSAARAHALGSSVDVVAQITTALRGDLKGRPAAAVVWFASASYDPATLAGPLTRAFPEAEVIGCSTAGEFTDTATGTGGVSAVALPQGLVVRCASSLGDLVENAGAGTDSAIAAVEGTFGPLRALDPARHLGLVLIDGLHAQEELVNERLGNAAPLLDFVGGSAGDDLAFHSAWVTRGEHISRDGVALLVAELAVPFQIVKTCSFTPSGRTLRITKADVPTRTVCEFDGRPAVEAYGEAVGVDPARIDSSVFTRHPVGLMIDGHPWIRSPRAATPEGYLSFYAQILEGMDVEVMNPGDMIGETRAAIDAAVASLGGRSSGGILFNCILRRLEIDTDNGADAFVAALGQVPLAGFHTYGETWLGHVNQTLTGVLFG